MYPLSFSLSLHPCMTRLLCSLFDTPLLVQEFSDVGACREDMLFYKTWCWEELTLLNYLERIYTEPRRIAEA